MERSVISNCIGWQPGDIELSQEDEDCVLHSKYPQTPWSFQLPLPKVRPYRRLMARRSARSFFVDRAQETPVFDPVSCSAFLVSPFVDSHSARSSRDKPGSTGILRFASSISHVYSDSRKDLPSAGSRRTICSSRSASSIFLSRRHLLMRGNRTAIPERCRDDR